MITVCFPVMKTVQRVVHSDILTLQFQQITFHITLHIWEQCMWKKRFNTCHGRMRGLENNFENDKRVQFINIRLEEIALET